MAREVNNELNRKLKKRRNWEPEIAAFKKQLKNDGGQKQDNNILPTFHGLLFFVHVWLWFV